MKVAIAHDYLTQLGGAERVVLSMHKAFPESPIHTLLFNPETTYPEFGQADVRVSGLNRVSLLRQRHRAALPFLSFAADRMHIDADVVLISSSGWAHGFPTQGKKLVYCHTPARWLYATQEYLGERRSVIGPALATLSPWLRRWDRQAAATVDQYIANSHAIHDRIEQAYGRDSDVLFPPQRVDMSGPREQPAALIERGWTDYHLIVSRLLPYKNVDLAIGAFNQLPHERLVIVGRGPDAERLRGTMSANSVLLEGIPDAELRWLYEHATALIAPSHEDFGLTVLEAGAFGTPTLAVRDGGYLDTVIDGESGYFFERQTVDDIVAAVRRHRASPLPRDAVARRAESFNEDGFVEALREAVSKIAQS